MSQRLTIEWRRPAAYQPPEPPLTDEAHFFQLHVKECGGELYLVAERWGEDGEACGEHLVPYLLVRSASAVPIDDEPAG